MPTGPVPSSRSRNQNAIGRTQIALPYPASDEAFDTDERADAAYSVSDAGPGGSVASGVAAASQGHGGLRAFDRASSGQHNRPLLGDRE